MHIWEGQFEDDKLNGFGRWLHSDGECYIGYWKDSKRHGYGKSMKTFGLAKEGLFEYAVKGDPPKDPKDI